MRYILIFLSLISGLFLYLGFRSTNTPIYQWAINLGFQNEINRLRNSAQGIYLPDWFIYSVPDGLWMFAFVLTVLSIWNFNADKTSGIWICTSILIGLGFEILQSCVKGLGVFDWKDLFLMMLGAGLAFAMFSNKIVPLMSIILNKIFIRS